MRKLFDYVMRKFVHDQRFTVGGDFTIVLLLVFFLLNGDKLQIDPNQLFHLYITTLRNETKFADLGLH